MFKQKLKKIILCIFLVLLMAIVWQIYQNRPQVIIKSLAKNTKLNKDNPELLYCVKFFGILPVGEAILYPVKEDTYQGKEIYYLEAEAYPYAYLARLFKFKAKIQSYIERKNRLPIFFNQEIEAGEKSDRKEVFYDQERQIMTLRKEERTILPSTYEPLSAILNLRKMDFDTQKEFDLNINTNQKNYAMQGTVLSKRQVPQGNFWIIRSQIQRRDKNNPYHRSKVSLYLLDNPARTPFLIEVFASGAYIVAKLIDVR